MTKRQIILLSAILIISILFGISVSADFLLSDDIPEYPETEDNSYSGELIPEYDVTYHDELPITRVSVIVPSCLPITVSENGIVTAAAYAQIVNSSSAAVKVTDILVSGENGWSVVPYSRDMASEKVDSRQIGLKINNAETTISIDNTAALELVDGEWTIPPQSSLPLYYDAVVSANSLPVVDLQVMTLYFVVGWA